MRNLLKLFAGLLLFLACETPNTAYVAVEAYNYLLQLPQNYDAGIQHPLIVFLHGAGCGSMDMELYRYWGLGKYADAHPDFPFVVVAPQSHIDWQMEPLSAVIDEVSAEYNVDPNRIYVTGFSMGGHGSLMLALAYPRRFAAVAPVCGFWYTHDVNAISHLPVWLFHCDEDPTVPFWESQLMYNALEAAGADVQLTVYNRYSHDAWSETYANPDLYEWFLSHTRQDP